MNNKNSYKFVAEVIKINTKRNWYNAQDHAYSSFKGLQCWIYPKLVGSENGISIVRILLFYSLYEVTGLDSYWMCIV